MTPDFKKLHDTGAIFSPCGRWRYALYRPLFPWLQGGRPNDCTRAMLVIGLNPSTAGRYGEDDQTVKKVMGFAMRNEFDGVYIGNLFAWCATDPADLKRTGVGGGCLWGEENKEWLVAMAERVTGYRSDLKPGPVVAAWGNHGAYMGQDRTVIGWLDPFKLQCFAMTEQWMPYHPLMLPYKRGVIREMPLTFKRDRGLA